MRSIKWLFKNSCENYDTLNPAFAKENINPNINMKTKINNNEGKSRDSIVKCMQLANTISMKTFNESHTTSHKDIIEKSKTSRIPLFEFTNKVPSQSDAKFMFKENIKKGNLIVQTQYYVRMLT